MTVEPGIRTLIVDDEPLAIERMQMLCARERRLALVGTAGDGESALRLVASLEPELILLDIAMPLLDGMAVARRLAATDSPPAIIFVTAFDGFAIEAFDVAAADYLLKPVAPDRLARAIDRLWPLIEARRSSEPGRSEVAAAITTEFWVPHRSELVRIDADEIYRIEAERDYMRLHLGTRSYLLHETISALEQRLDPARFIRLHRSHIVRRDRIASLRHDGNGVWFATLAPAGRDGGAAEAPVEIRIGRTYLPHVKATMLG